MKSGLRVIFNTFSQILSRSLVILVSLVTTALLTRLLGSSGYGNYVFITSFILIFANFSDLGLNLIGIRELSLRKKEGERIFGSILLMRLILTLLLFVFFNLASNLPQFAGLKTATFIASFVLFFLTTRTVFQGILQTHLRFDLSSSLEVFASLFLLLFLGIFFFIGKVFSLNLLMLIWTVSACLSSVYGFLIARKFEKIKLVFDKRLSLDLLKEALPLGAYLLVFSVYDRGIDSFILKSYFDSSIVGYYGLAYKIHGNLVLGAAFLMSSLFPLISSLKGDSEKLKLIFKKAYTILFLSGFIILIGGVIFAPVIIRLIAGNSFSPSIIALRLLLMGTFFAYLNHLTGYLLIAVGEQKQLLLFSLVAFSVNLILNLIFIPRFSFLAAATITVLTELTILIFTQNFLTKEFGLKYNLQDLKVNLLEIFQKKQHYFDSL